MITLHEVGIILFPSPRARAYLQALMKSGFCPGYAILVDKEYNPGQVFSEGIREKFFNISRDERETLKEMGVKYTVVNAVDVNDSTIYDVVKDLPQKILVYTGGGIAGNKLLSLKKLIHIHPGIVPSYRGSTCFYYSIINEGTIGMSALFLSDEIDKGLVLGRKIYPVPGNVDVDHILDPHLRSQLLVEVIKGYAKKGRFDPILQSPEEGETYYIIHPVLKHIAILKVNLSK